MRGPLSRASLTLRERHGSTCPLIPVVEFRLAFRAEGDEPTLRGEIINI